MKISLHKILLTAFLLALPIALFAVLRAQASWRPQRVAVTSLYGLDALSPQEDFVATTAFNDPKIKPGIVFVVDLSNGREVNRRDFGFGQEVSAMQFSPNGQMLAVAWHEDWKSDHRNSDIITLSLWNWRSKVPPMKLEIVTSNLTYDEIIQLCFSPDGKTLWLVSEFNLRAWDVTTGQLKWQLHPKGFSRGSAIQFFATISEDCRLYFRCDSNGYTVWDIKKRQPIFHSDVPNSSGEEINFSPDASLLTYRSSSNTYRIVSDTRTARILWRASFGSAITFVGDKAVVRDDGDKLEVRDAHSGNFLYLLPQPSENFVFLNSRSWLFSVNDQGELFRQRLR